MGRVVRDDVVALRARGDEALAIFEVFCGTIVGQEGVSAGKYENVFARRDDPHLWQKVAESGRSALHRGQVIGYSHLNLVSLFGYGRAQGPLLCTLSPGQRSTTPPPPLQQVTIESYYSITSVSYNLDDFKSYRFSYSDRYIFFI